MCICHISIYTFLCQCIPAAYLLSHLQEKLAKAVSQITLLSREKAQLLEIGNSLKSELGNLRRQGLQNVENYRMEKGIVLVIPFIILLYT